MRERFVPYESDILFLLVGTNPLPNYIAAMLLCSTNGTVYALHTKDTGALAHALQVRLSQGRPDLTLVPREIHEIDGERITREIEKILQGMSIDDKRVGLNYSGGKKVMAVHSFYALRNRFPRGCYSYLDGRTLSMVIASGDQPIRVLPIKRDVSLSLTELLSLHGYRLNREPRREPLQPGLCEAIARVHSVPGGFRQWREWVHTLDQTPELPRLEVYPELAPVCEAFANMCQGEPTPAKVAEALGFAQLSSCAKFFVGEWLEHYTLHAIAQITEELDITREAYGANLWIRASRFPSFEVDVAVMIGYQLFAISCIATQEAKEGADATKPGKAKEHLFEAFVRARQLGGDEACIGLVSCVQDAKNLEREIKRDWNEDKIRIFGQSDLLMLPDKLKRWLETASN